MPMAEAQVVHSPRGWALIVVPRRRIDRFVLSISLAFVLALCIAGWVSTVRSSLPTGTNSVIYLPHPTPDPHPLNRGDGI